MKINILDELLRNLTFRWIHRSISFHCNPILRLKEVVQYHIKSRLQRIADITYDLLEELI
jgi:hypothetical protein